MSNVESRKPKIRFKGFTDPWEQRKLGDIAHTTIGEFVIRTKQKPNSPYPVYNGGTSYTGFYDEYNNEANQIVISARGANAGFVNIVRRRFWGGNSCYAVNFIDKENFDLDFTYQSIKNNQSGFIENQQAANIPSVSKSDVETFVFQCPKFNEQRQIGTFFAQLDDLITLHQRKLNALKKVKKSLLEKMFPKPGEFVPEIRFKGFTDPWEQRKFSDFVLIERGGSPRPIDAFITEDSAGLNWVKIGDAPSMGRYITSTSEKIKLEGLSKTRQVYPGDLVLSNSMSFGRPYIMAVEGCIHDGWLLIRDTQNQFDPVFLCHMLGTPQMLDQYRMFASGSTVNNLNKELVGNAMVPLPNRDEQVKIGKYLDEIDRLITLHQRKLNALKNVKKSLLEKMFV